MRVAVIANSSIGGFVSKAGDPEYLENFFYCVHMQINCITMAA